MLSENPEDAGFDVKTSSKVDVWSLGCILSEVCVWIVAGREELQAYRERRREKGYSYHEGGRILDLIAELHEGLDMDPRCDPITSQVWQILPSMLSLDPDARPSIDSLLESIEAATEYAATDADTEAAMREALEEHKQRISPDINRRADGELLLLRKRSVSGGLWDQERQKTKTTSDKKSS